MPLSLPPGVVIFALVYCAIAARRLGWLGLDRPAGALVGAVACVAAGALAPDEALAAVDGHTLVLLFGVMGMGAFLGADGFFDRAAAALAARARTPARLLGAVVWGSGAFAALITNDAVCVLGTPVVVELIRRHRLPALPFLLAIATAANTGSVATLVGNPQNMLCASLGDLAYRDYALRLAPVAVIALALNHGVLWWCFRRELAGGGERAGRRGGAGTPEGDRAGAVPTAGAPLAPPAALTRASGVTLAVIAATALALSAGADLAWTATGGLAALLLVHRLEPAVIWARIDWSILVFFAGLFIVVEALVRSGAPAWLFAHMPLWTGGAAGWPRLAALFLVGSNVVSNVPFILVVREQMAGLPDPVLGWQMLAMASTFAGNLTLLGSVANIIVAEKGRAVGGLGFWSYLRVGAPVAIGSTVLGTLWLLAVG